MKINAFYQVVDAAGKVRFESIYNMDSQFYVKKLLKRLKPGQPKPTIREVKR